LQTWSQSYDFCIYIFIASVVEGYSVFKVGTENNVYSTNALSYSLLGANPTIVIYNASVVNFYNASVVNFYNAMGSLARFENKNILFYFVKRSSLLQRWRCICKLKNRRIGSRLIFTALAL
jgi:hypothetical protein